MVLVYPRDSSRPSRIVVASKLHDCCLKPSRAKVLVRMSGSRDQLVLEEEEEIDLRCSEGSLKDKMTITAIGKVNQICNCH